MRISPGRLLGLCAALLVGCGGSEVIVWGGTEDGFTPLGDGARFVP